jgi:general stress protein 26
MTTHEKLDENLRKLRQMIKGIDFAMLTTVEDDGSLRSRPMATLKGEFEGDLYFFTKAGAPKVDAVERDRHVSVSYAAPETQRYVSMSGLARLLRDRKMMEELWFPELKVWFPGGLEEPDLALLWISITQAEYWEGPFGTILYLGGVKTMAAGAAFEDVSVESKPPGSEPAPPKPDSTLNPGGPSDWAEHED